MAETGCRGGDARHGASTETGVMGKAGITGLLSNRP